MIHRILTCKEHPDLRWSTKDCAWSQKDDGTGFYNSSRNISFKGIPTGNGMYDDNSGLSCSSIGVSECDCPSSKLILAPEDHLVARHT